MRWNSFKMSTSIIIKKSCAKCSANKLIYDRNWKKKFDHMKENCQIWLNRLSLKQHHAHDAVSMKQNSPHPISSLHRLNLAPQICSRPFQASKSLPSEWQTLTRLSLVLDGWPAARHPGPIMWLTPFPRHSATAQLDVREWVLPVGAQWECRLRAISLGCQRGLSLRLNNDWGLHSKELLGALQENASSVVSIDSFSLSAGLSSQNIHAYTGT